MGFLLGFIFFGFFYVLGSCAGELLYPGQNVGDVLTRLSYCCIFMYVEQIMAGIMNGLNKQGTSLITSAAGYALTMAFIWFGIPVMGVRAYILGTILGMAVTAVLNLCVIVKTTGLSADVTNWILKPFAVSACCILVGKGA